MSAEIRKKLDEKIPRDCVSTRVGGAGTRLSYLEGHYVISRLNEVLGQGGWHYETEEMRMVYQGQVNGKEVAHYIAKVTLHVPALKGEGAANYCYPSFSDYGYGDGSDKFNPGKAHELAVKEAVTDGLKRCAKNLGMSMGLALYSKEQENVDDGQEQSGRGAPSNGGAESKGAGNVSSAPTPTNSGAKAEAAAPVGKKELGGGSKVTPETPPEDRGQLEQMIAKMSTVAIAQKKTDLLKLRTEMRERYKTDKKEELTAEQAKGLYAHLRGMIYDQAS